MRKSLFALNNRPGTQEDIDHLEWAVSAAVSVLATVDIKDRLTWDDNYRHLKECVRELEASRLLHYRLNRSQPQQAQGEPA